MYPLISYGTKHTIILTQGATENQKKNELPQGDFFGTINFWQILNQVMFTHVPESHDVGSKDELERQLVSVYRILNVFQTGEGVSPTNLHLEIELPNVGICEKISLTTNHDKYASNVT